MKSSKKAKYPTLQIVEGIREGKKVRQRTVAHLGVVKGKQDLERLKNLADKLIQRLEKEGLSIDPKVELKKLQHKQTIYDGFGIVTERLMTLTGFDKVIQTAQGKRKYDLLSTLQLLLAQRFDLPSSKLRTYERQEEHGFTGIDLQNLYRAMDAIFPLEEAIQKQAITMAFEKDTQEAECFFFDVTTFYFESIVQDTLRDFGFSKDQKPNLTQIVFAIVVNSEGIPLTYEIFKGNLGETKTLIPVLEKLRNQFGIKKAIIVCDRGIASKNNIEAIQKAKFNFVIATKLKGMSKTLKINDLTAYQFLQGQESLPIEERLRFRVMEHPQYANTQMMVTYSPKRAKKDKEDRERLIEKLQRKLSSSNETSIKKMICNKGYGKYTSVKKGSLIILDEEAIKEDALWDGFHGLAVSKDTELTIEQALGKYKDLWHVEETFRITKYTLETRPVFHWIFHRIRSHILLCFMNLFLERFLEKLLKRQNMELTPDRIRHALSQVHTTIFEDQSSHRSGQMQSTLTEDAKKIFQVLDISTERSTTLKTECCA